MRSGDHVVQTYSDPHTLRASVGAWLAPALRCGSGALLACTPEHAEMAREELRAVGIDVDAAEREGRFAARDANSLLAGFMREGMPHGASFKRTARELIGGIRASGAVGPIRAWGEMVNILAKRGETDAAHRLEELWNEVIAEEDLQLLCSYEMDSLDPASHARVLLAACSTHSDLVPEEGPALTGAVSSALDDVFGANDANALRRVLPTRSSLLERMSVGSAILLSLRTINPELGEEIARRARVRIVKAAPTPAAPTLAPRSSRRA